MTTPTPAPIVTDITDTFSPEIAEKARALNAAIVRDNHHGYVAVIAYGKEGGPGAPDQWGTGGFTVRLPDDGLTDDILELHLRIADTYRWTADDNPNVTFWYQKVGPDGRRFRFSNGMLDRAGNAAPEDWVSVAYGYLPTREKVLKDFTLLGVDVG